MLINQPPAALLRQAMALHQAGKLRDAVALYRKVLAADPGSCVALRSCAAALLDLKQIFDATQMLLAAVAADPGDADAHGLLGNAHQLAGRIDKAEACYRRALEVRPRNAQAQNNLGFLLQRRGRNDEAASCFRAAIAIEPRYAQAHNNLSQALAVLGELDGAIAAARQASLLQPGYADAHNSLGSALGTAGRTAEAIAACRRAVELRPTFVAALNNLAVALLISGRPAEALAACDQALAASPGDIMALAAKSVALTELGEDRAQAALVDLDALVRTVKVEPGAGHAGLAAFNAALVRHILGHPTLAYEPEGHTTRKGRHTGELLAEPKGPFAAFETAVNDAVASYIAALPDDPSHPVVASVPRKWKLTVWSVVMEGDGHQLAHIHPSGWLSGVYYPKVPADMGSAPDDPRGWIEYGRPQDIYAATRMPPLRLIRPEEGMMVLFPSYYYHRTVPTGSQDLRVSIAFDVMPRR